MKELISLVITLFCGILFLVGVLITQKAKNKRGIYAFSASLAFSVMLGLVFVDIIPEIFSSFGSYSLYKKIIYFLSFTLMGILILKIFDGLIPAHHHEHHHHEKNVKEHNDHLYHVGFLTTIALIIHNIIEGFALYTLTLSDFHLGLLMCVGVGLHNIPMGMQISLSFELANLNKMKKGVNYLLLILSCFIGGLLAFLITNVSEMILGILLCFTCGMLLYISLFELLGEIKSNWKDKFSQLGILSGIILIVLSLVL